MRDEAGHILSVASFVGLGLGDAISVIARVGFEPTTFGL